MSDKARQAKVYLEDTVECLQGQVGLRGVVTRTWHDIEQPEDSEPLSASLGEFEVHWLDDLGAFAKSKVRNYVTILQEDSTDYKVIDRSFGLGDAVKLDSASAMSGIVQDGQTYLVLRNFATREIRSSTGNDITIESELVQPGDYVVCEDWVGIVKDVESRSLIAFEQGHLAFCYDETDIRPVQYEPENTFNPGLHESIFKPDLLPSTTLVEVSKSGVKHAKYLRKQYEKGMSRRGIVCFSYTSAVAIEWQFQNMMTHNFVAKPRPAEEFDLAPFQDETTLPFRICKLFDGKYSHQIGDVVRLKDRSVDISVAMLKTLEMENFKTHCQDWEIISTKQQMTVKWQDGTTSTHEATALVPYLNVDDLDLWPADHVISKSAGKRGIVQTCDAEDRTALVKWTGELSLQEESLYELMNDGAYNIDLGDLVLIIPEEGMSGHQVEPSAWGPSAIVNGISTTITRYMSSGIAGLKKLSSTMPDSVEDSIEWFGQLIAIDQDGLCSVLLGYSYPPRTITVPLGRLVHVASSNEDDASETTSNEDTDFDVDSTDSDSDAYTSDSSENSNTPAAPWIDEHGHEVLSDDDADWIDDSDAMLLDADANDDDDMFDIVDESHTGPPPTTDIVLDAVSPDVDAATMEQADRLLAAAAIQRTPGRAARANEARNGTQITPTTAHDRSSEVCTTAQPVVFQSDVFPVSDNYFVPFIVLDEEPEDHTYRDEILNSRSTAMRRLAQEYKSLNSSLPPGILVRSYESRMDLLRILILGPLGTPYEFAPILFDVYIPPEYPEEPPLVHFHSWTNGIGKINPNLYEEGKVCLSLLGTWHGNSESETWSARSSLLQIFVSLQALVLVKEPYYNEAGYDVLSAKDTAVAAANYSERAYVLTRNFVLHILQNPVKGLHKELHWLYLDTPAILQLVVERGEIVANNSLNVASNPDVLVGPPNSSIHKVSRGALLILQRTLKDLRTFLSTHSP